MDLTDTHGLWVQRCHNVRCEHLYGPHILLNKLVWTTASVKSSAITASNFQVQVDKGIVSETKAL